MIRRAVARVTLVGAVAATFLASAALSSTVRPAWGHPSDFSTLTLDLLFGSDGLETIDAAVVSVAGPSYEPLPSEDRRRALALQVLDALGIPLAGAVVDASNSDRYHEVGFSIDLSPPIAYSDRGAPFQIQTGRLQQVTEAAGVRWLKLEICELTDEKAADFLVNGARPGRDHDARNDRESCEVWQLAPGDVPLSLIVGIAPPLAATGNGSTATVCVAIMTLACGIALTTVCIVSSRRGRRASCDA